MSHENPTPIRIGMTGTLAGTRYRVAGRVVMGAIVDGTVYYWNEFNLVSDDGDFITLVHEPSEDGDLWRLFTMFEPQTPMTVPQASKVKVGDRVNLEGNSIRVTLVDESRVYFIEGEAPEGVEVNDVANYFNTETANKMQVVSWTGDEVECYRGVTLRPEVIAAAFNIKLEPRRQFSSATLASGLVSRFEAAKPASVPWVLKLVVVGLFLIIAFSIFSSCRTRRPAPAFVRKSAPSATLAVGSSGMLGGKNYRILGHALVEISQVGVVHERHEYQLGADDGQQALLVYGAKTGVKEWGLFQKLAFKSNMKPTSIAALKLGEKLDVDGSDFTVMDMFLSTARESDITGSPDLKSGTVTYGLNAQAGYNRLLARWNEQEVTLYRGTIVAAKDVTTAFKSSTQ